MSHFFTVVLVPDGTEDVEAKIRELLSPYNENTSVEPYLTKCYCVGVEANRAARREAVRTTGTTLEQIRGKFWAERKSSEDEDEEAGDRAWEEAIAPFRAAEESAEKAHPLYEKPDADCEECSGTGQRQTTYNPLSKWDWWRIGGRWDGNISGQDRPSEDGGFNFGGDYESLEANSIVVSKLADDFSCFALVTPDGQWHEKGSMGMWGMVSDPKDLDDWLEQLHGLLVLHGDCLAVGCDLHI